MNPVFTFILGLPIGWLIEWLMKNPCCSRHATLLAGNR